MNNKEDTLLMHYDRLLLLSKLLNEKIDIYDLWVAYGYLSTPILIKAMEERITNIQKNNGIRKKYMEL